MPLTKFEIMRGRRAAREQVNVTERINAIEAQVDREWAQHRRGLQAERREQFGDSGGWVRQTRDIVRMQKPCKPNLFRRAWNFAFGLGENA